MIDPQQLRLICTRCLHTDEYAPLLWSAMQKVEIITVTRAGMFIAQMAHESAEFNALEEMSSGQQYEGRIDLGNTQPGDGKRYKGRGFIQLTGRASYKAAGFEDCPEKAADPINAAAIAAWFWTVRAGQCLSRAAQKYVPVGSNLNDIADKLDFAAVTYSINGGLNGFENRLWYYRRALEVFGVNAKL